MDRGLIHTWLSRDAYWALGRTRETQDAAILGSRNFAVFRLGGQQVAYARVVTDGATFAWLCDVFVDPSERGRGIGAGLIALICDELDRLDLKRIVLATGDAQDFYRRFGFEVLAAPDQWMSKLGES
ncbi:MAG: family N-acetyltransferase [Nocardioidaceae bacterium]|nr:family N-acetyltransferase [Nocardioidaceae bacterium]